MAKLREPRPHEAHLFNEIYVDETSQNDHDFLIRGGIMLPREYSAQFEQDIINARLPKLPATGQDGSAREVKWSEFTSGDLATYKNVVDAFFTFARHFKTTRHVIRFHCSVVDCRIKGRRYSGKSGQLPFNREIYFHCLSIGRRYRENLFHVYPDCRQTDMTMGEMQVILGRAFRREDSRDWPFRRVRFRHSHESQALQVSDILIGALAYKLNGHYDAPNASAAKRQLCDYIISKGKAGIFVRKGSPQRKDWGNFRIWVRRHRERD
jgi:hypothetical protein